MAEHIYNGTVNSSQGNDDAKMLRQLATKYKCSVTIKTEQISDAIRKLHYSFEGTFEQISSVKKHFEALAPAEESTDDSEDAPYQVYPFKGWGVVSTVVFKDDL